MKPLVVTITRPRDHNTYASGDAFAESDGRAPVVLLERADEVLHVLRVSSSRVNPEGRLAGKVCLFDGRPPPQVDNTWFDIDGAADRLLATVPFTLVPKDDGRTLEPAIVDVGATTIDCTTATMGVAIQIENPYTPMPNEQIIVEFDPKNWPQP